MVSLSSTLEQLKDFERSPSDKGFGFPPTSSSSSSSSSSSASSTSASPSSFHALTSFAAVPAVAFASVETESGEADDSDDTEIAEDDEEEEDEGSLLAVQLKDFERSPSDNGFGFPPTSSSSSSSASSSSASPSSFHALTSFAAVPAVAFASVETESGEADDSDDTEIAEAPSHIAIDEAVWVAPGATSPFRGKGAAATVTRVREGGGVDVKFVMGGSESDVSLARIRVFNPVPNADRTRSRTSHTSRADHDSRATRRSNRASSTRYEKRVLPYETVPA
jgi:hypothetical protein